MSDDLIKRSDAIKATWQEPTYTDPLNVLTEVRDRIEAIPSADIDLSGYSDKLWKNAYERGKADRPQGEWIYTMNPLRLNDEWECNKCGYLSFTKANYCGHCGCRMKGATDGNK